METNRPFIDFKAIKSRVPIIDLLGRYGAKLVRVNQTTLRGNCPLPSHGSKSQQTFYVNDAKAVWYCHSSSCKKNGNRAGGNVIDFVTLIESLSVYEAAKRLDEMFPVAAKNLSVERSEHLQPVEPADAAVDPFNKPLAFRLKDINPEHSTIQGRGITVATAALFGIGFFPGKGSMANRIVFELHERGQLVGYTGRTTLPVTAGNPKWLFGKGLKKTFLYGLERCEPVRPLILVESPWGPPFFYEKGVQVASLMGSELTEAQERCLEPFPIITLALDNDAAGVERAGRIRARLKARHKVLLARLVG